MPASRPTRRDPRHKAARVAFWCGPPGGHGGKARTDQVLDAPRATRSSPRTRHLSGGWRSLDPPKRDFAHTCFQGLCLPIPPRGSSLPYVEGPVLGFTGNLGVWSNPLTARGATPPQPS